LINGLNPSWEPQLQVESKERSPFSRRDQTVLNPQNEKTSAEASSSSERVAADSSGNLPPKNLPDTAITFVPAATFLGRYVIEQPIGAGGMGEVYRARDTRLERTVALKMLPRETAGDSELRRRFLNEARAASALNHPNIVALYDICTDKNIDFLVMEYVDGRTLKELIASDTLTFEQLAQLGSQVALALGAAHAAGIVHRDIKPANIMVTRSNEAKVLDFGIAKLARSDSNPQLTTDGQIIGTVAYMSPEQTRGEDTDFRSDIFSFGCVLYESAIGRPPFEAASALGLMHQIATSDPEPPSLYRADLQPEFVRLVMRCLCKDRALRPDSAVELATELKSLTFPHQPRIQSRIKRPSIAVVPLKVRGPAADQFLSISLAEALIHRLSSTDKLQVRPISSVIRYASDENDWARVARELNVDLVVEGAVQIAGGKIRALVQIHRASDTTTLASLKQDGDSSDLFALQDRLADLVSDVFVPRQRVETDTRVSPTKSPEAFEFYLRAVDRQVHVDKFEMASAIELLTRATELDPAFADAWGLLAQACGQMGSHLDADPKWFELGEQAIARTLELDPVQCTALCARSMILWSTPRGFQNRAALRALNAAIKIDPARPTARHQRSAILWHLGFLDAAEQDANELQSANPVLSLMHLGAIALQRGDFDESSERYARALEIEPNTVLTRVMAPIPILYAGHIEEARSAVEKARRMFPAESFGLGLESIIAGIDGDHARAEILADEAARAGHSMTHTHHTWHSCAAAYALSGKPEKALRELERCAALGLPNYRLFEVDPYLRPLRNNPQFAELMTNLRREHDSIRDEFGLEP
jgi:serine/threonine protein kinase/tetratricopeptide (TPR) repeat protein